MPNIAKALEKAGKSPAYAKTVEYLTKDHDWHVSREIEHECYLPQPQVSMVVTSLIGAGFAQVQMKRKEPSKGRPISEYRISEEAEKKLFTDLRAGIEKEFKEKVEALEEI